MVSDGREKMMGDRKDDPALHHMYSRKLLIPGWAGELTDAEAQHIAEKLRGSATLRRSWAVRKFTRYRKRITPAIVKRMAAAWAINPVLGVKGLSTASGEKTAGEKDINGQEGQLALSIQ